MKFRAFVLLASFAGLAAGTIVAQQSGVKSSEVVRTRGNVLAVEDSDRVKIATDEGNIYSLTLLGVDAPDEKQDHFKNAKKRLAELVRGKEVTVILRTNEMNETFATVYAGAEDVGLRLIQDGLAWYSPRRGRDQNAADRDKYIQAENSARSAKTGLWKDKDPIAPWTFRGEKMETAPVTLAASADTSKESTPKSHPVPGRTYILGPRGGCYYLNESGIKVYVKDKSLCSKP